MIKGTLATRWEQLEGRKKDLHTRCEKYARWTLPHLYPQTHQEGYELDSDLDSTGARAVNHLANRLANTLFPASRPFYRLELEPDAARALAELEGVDQNLIDRELVAGEKYSTRVLSDWKHRTAAATAASYLIVTGNALAYYPEAGGVQVYNTRDYCVVRDLAGTVIEILMRENKAFETFSKEVQSKLQANTTGRSAYESNTNVTVYTSVKLMDEKYKVTQAADNVELEVANNFYSKKDMPWIVLTWKLIRGEDYGRGLVEEYRGAFNAIDKLSQAMIEGVIIAATIKYFVDPASSIDVQNVNKSRNGSYHSGRGDGITSMATNKHMDFAQVRETLADYQRQIAHAFLLNSGITRDAERVTAEEIREQAEELEVSYGGVYSQFTDTWQLPVANLIQKKRATRINGKVVYTRIITGLDTLSRTGDVNSYRYLIQDMANYSTLPPDVRMNFKEPQLFSWLATNHGVDYDTFLKTAAEVEQMIAEQKAEQQAMMQAGTEQQMALDANKEIVKGV